MGLSLEMRQPGGSSPTFQWLLHSSGGDLATGFRVSLGDGTDTPLFLSDESIGFYSPGGFLHEIGSEATAARAVMLTDSSGKVEPVMRAILGTDATNSTTTASAISDFSVDLEASTLYEFEAVLLAQSAATTTGVQFTLEGPAGIDFVAYEVSHITGTTLATGNRRSQLLTAFATTVANTDAPAANTTFPIHIRGMLRTTGASPSAPLSFTLRSEVATSQVTVKAGSVLRVRKLS